MATSDIIREQVRAAMLDNPGIKSHEIAATLGISKATVLRHIKALREAWKSKGETK